MHACHFFAGRWLQLLACCEHRRATGQARIGKYVAPEEEWLRLLTAELEPVMEHLQASELPPGAHAVHKLLMRSAVWGGQLPLRAAPIACRHPFMIYNTGMHMRPCTTLSPVSDGTLCFADRREGETVLQVDMCMAGMCHVQACWRGWSAWRTGRCRWARPRWATTAATAPARPRTPPSCIARCAHMDKQALIPPARLWQNVHCCAGGSLSGEGPRERHGVAW